MSGFPLSAIRRLCREGKIPFWDFHKRYLMDPDKAYEALLNLQGPGNVSGSAEDEGSFVKHKVSRDVVPRVRTVKRGRKLCSYRPFLDAAASD